MICVAHLERDRTGSRATVVLPERFADPDHWQNTFGDDWCDQHWRHIDAHVAVHVGWDWDLDNIEFFLDLDEFQGEFSDCSFLEETDNEK